MEARRGSICAISEWLQIAAGCQITAGKDGEFGAVRSVAGEVLVGKTDLSYTYQHRTVREGQPYNSLPRHVRGAPGHRDHVEENCLYDLFRTVSMLPDAAAKERDLQQRTATFTRTALQEHVKTFSRRAERKAGAASRHLRVARRRSF